MSVFTLDLDDEERDAMEAHRIRLGLRSGAETIRALLLSNPVLVTHEWVDPAGRTGPKVLTKHELSAEDIQRGLAPYTTGLNQNGPQGLGMAHTAAVPTLTRKAFNPQPKPSGKKKA